MDANERIIDSRVGLTDPKPKKKYGEPGSMMKASDGTIYQVQRDGSWRRMGREEGGSNGQR